MDKAEITIHLPNLGSTTRYLDMDKLIEGSIDMNKRVEDIVESILEGYYEPKE